MSLLALEQELYSLHAEACQRNNCSTMCLLNAYAGSGDINQSICSAVLSFGQAHGPIRFCYDILKNPDIVKRYKIVPGFGSSFEEPEDKYNKVRSLIDPDLVSIIDNIASSLPVSPNIAIYTAAYAVMAGMPSALSPSLILKFRLDVWVNLIKEKFNII